MSRQERRRQAKEQAKELKRATAALAPYQLLELGLVHHRAGRHAEAEAVYRQLLDRVPGDVNACHLIGVIVFERGDKATALDWFERALRNKPDHVEAAIFRGLCRMNLGRLDAAVGSFHRALALRPAEATIYNDLGAAHLQQGDAVAALGRFADAVALNPDSGLYWRNHLLTHNLVADIDPARQLTAIRRWSVRFAAPLNRAAAPHDNDRGPDRRLRIGYVGGRLFGFHTQSTMFLPILENHDPAAVETFCYSDLTEPEEDPITRRYQGCSTWRRSGELNDDALARAIRNDRIDVLIDTVGLVEGSRLLAFARHPAPVRAMLPPMMSLGGDVVDYLVADPFILPAAHESRFAERIERVPSVYRWRPLIEAPPVRTERGCGPIVFGSTNNLSKLGPATIMLWARVLAAVPDARLLIKGRGLDDTGTRAALIDRFAMAGIAVDRLDLRGWTPDLNGHLTIFGEIDMALDAVPYGGVTTTCEALWMGVPVVTLAGDRLLGRYGLALLEAVGLEEGIARTADEYVAKAAALAADAVLRRSLRLSLRDRLAASALCDGVSGARQLEAAYRRMWRRWCAAQASARGPGDASPPPNSGGERAEATPP
jgi:predicted O-linked N-acetylglucosamine transferase (SPINDLY family)